MFSDIFLVKNKEIIFWHCGPTLGFGFCNGIFKHPPAWSKIQKEVAQTVNGRCEFPSGNLHFFMEYIALLSFQMTKLEQLVFNRLIVGAFANSFYWMLRLGGVKHYVVKTFICVHFVQNFLWYFFVNWIQVEQTGNFLFGRHQLPSVSNFSQTYFFDSVAVEAIQISKDSICQRWQNWQRLHCHQRDLNIFFG